MQAAFDETAKTWGFPAVEDLRLNKGEAEIRVWRSGFSPEGYILQLRDGEWQVYHVGVAAPRRFMQVRYGYTGAKVHPNCPIENVIRALETEGIYDLEGASWPSMCVPDPDGGPCLETITLDGWSARIQTRRGKRTQDHTYDNPSQISEGGRETPPEMVRVARIVRLLHESLTPKGAYEYLPHSQNLQVPGVVLVRIKGVYVSAFEIREFTREKGGGKLTFSAQYFAEEDQGFSVHDTLTGVGQTLTWTGAIMPPVDREFLFDLRTREQGLEVNLVVQETDDQLAYELAIPAVKSIDELTYEHLAGGFEAVPYPIWGERFCSRVEPLPTPMQPAFPKMQVDAQIVDELEPWLLPPPMSTSNLVFARVDGPSHEIVVFEVQEPDDFKINDNVELRRSESAPLPNTDKPVIMYEVTRHIPYYDP